MEITKEQRLVVMLAYELELRQQSRELLERALHLRRKAKVLEGLRLAEEAKQTPVTKVARGASVQPAPCLTAEEMMKKLIKELGPTRIAEILATQK